MFTLLSCSAFSQNFYWVRGYVYSTDNQPLVGANVVDFNSKLVTATNSEGQYELKLAEGLHRISVTYLGFESINIEVALEKDVNQNIILRPDTKLLEEIEIKVKKRDYSWEVVKNVIEAKESRQDLYTNYACKTYIKATAESPLPIKKSAKVDSSKIKDKELIINPDSLSIEGSDSTLFVKTDSSKVDSLPKTSLSFFEANINRYFEFPNKTKEERTAVKKIGTQGNLYFTSTVAGEFDLYKNYQQIKDIGDNSYISPFSNIGLLSYKFTLIETYYVGTQPVYRIDVKPRELGNALYEGEIEVWDGIWLIKKVALSLPKRTLINYSEFSFSQDYETIEGKPMLTKATYDWKIGRKGGDITGRTIVEQRDFVFDSTYNKKFFGNMLGITTKEAYKKDSSFWEALRPVPLTTKERQTILAKEKLDIKLNSKEYLDSMDAITNKITALRLLWQGINHVNREKKQSWYFDPVALLINPVGIGGPRLRYGMNYSKRFENRKSFFIAPNLSYGFINKDLQGSIRANYFYNPIKVSSVNIFVGRSFDAINGAATISDIARRTNFYINDMFRVGHRTELFNGFYLGSRVNFSKRSDLTGYKFTKLGDKLFDNNTELTSFKVNNNLSTTIGINYTPKQLYALEPNQKVILGSKFPTFGLDITKAWAGKDGTNNQFVKMEFSVNHTINLGAIGVSQYSFYAGKFLDTTRLSPVDYKYIRGGDKWFFSPTMFTFQLIPKTFTTLNWFYEAHYEHQFNGFIASKIPLFNKTGIRTTAGAGFLYVPERNYQYSEVFFGINRIFKVGRNKFRIGAYSVSAQSNQFGVRTGFKFSFEPYNDYNNSWSF